VVVADVEIVIVALAALPETVTDSGLKLQDACTGRPVQERFTVPLNPALPLTATCVVTD